MPTFSKFLNGFRGCQQVLDSDLATPQRLELLTTLKRKAAEQPLSATQNLISGSAQHTESKTSLEFVLPPSCTSTRRDEQFILFDGKTDRDVRIIAFATNRNLHTLAEHNNWIADGTFYVAPKIFPQSYTIHSVIENKCLPLVYILTGDKKGDTYSYVLSVIKYFFDQNCPTDTGTVLIDFEKAVMNSSCQLLLPSLSVCSEEHQQKI